MAGWLTASLLLLLGALVVVWGTEYKLSLYKAEPTMQMQAKLCTRSSEAAKSELQLAIRPVEMHPLLVDTIASVLNRGDLGRKPRSIAESFDAPLPSSPRDLPQEAFRPPPALAAVAA